MLFRTSALLLCLFLLNGQIAPSSSENVLLFRLKKLRNNFLTQVDEQVAANEELLESQYLTTLKDLVDRISQTLREVVEEIDGLQKHFKGMSPSCEATVKPREMYNAADAVLNSCVSAADESVTSISEYVAKEIENYQLRSSNFSLWFADAYMDDWENIFSNAHYNDVYNELAAQVLQWDNIESVELFRFRLDAIQRLNSLTATIDECTVMTREQIATLYGATFMNALKCR